MLFFPGFKVYLIVNRHLNSIRFKLNQTYSVEKNRLNCRICNNSLPKNTILTINNAPSSAQGFSGTKNKKDNIKLKIYQCHNCGIVQISNKPVNYYKETIRSQVSQRHA